MEVRKGFKQTEVGVVPEDWDVLPFEEYYSFISYGFTNPMPTTESGIYMVTAKDINNGKIQLDTARFTTEEAYRALTAKSRPKKGDLLLTKDGALGRLALVDDTVMCINQSVAIIRLNNRAAPEFLKTLLEAPAYQSRMLEDAGGTTIKHIYITIVNKMPLAVPPTLAEQEAIAEALSDADALIEAVEQLLAKKRQVKQGAMSELLTGKRRLSGFSGEWEEKTFGDLFNFSGGFTASRDQLSTDGYCYLHYGDIHMSKKTFVDVQAEFQDIPKLNIPLKKVSTTSLLEDGDIVFVDASEDDEGASRHVVIVNPNKIPYISGLHTIVAKSKTDELEKQYRRYCFQTREVKNQFRFYAVGTKVSGISKTNIAKINLPVPSIPEQTAIAEILSDMDVEISALEGKLVKARQVKAGMMSDLLTGKIRLV